MTLEKRLVGQPGDGATTCLAGDILAVGTRRNEALTFRRSALGFAPEPAFPSASFLAEVSCDGDRVGVLSATSSPMSLRLYTPLGSAWSMNELALDPVTVSVAMSDHVVFAALAGTGVRAYRYGKVRGDACTDDASCAGTFCVDGVCCDSACGGGDPSDCQACSRAAGAASDGKCLPVGSTHVCRAERDACDVPDRCDGISLRCPADLVAPNGASCSGGACASGVCVVSGSGETPHDEATSNDATDDSSGGCNLSSGPRRRDTTLALAWLVAASVMISRRRRRRAAP